VTHPLLDRPIVRAVENAATEHRGRGWTWTGFTDRRELWRQHGYLGVIAVDGGGDFGRAFLQRLAAAVRQYA
jgi:hypothetical protein